MKDILLTPRLRLRRFELSDAEALYVIHVQEGVKRWIPNESYADVEEARGAIEFFADRVRAGELPYVLAIEEKESGELIGDCGINEVEGNSDQVEIGYCISETCSGQGYATEVVNALSSWIPERFGIVQLFGRVMKGNDASARVLEKNGYVFLREETDAEDDPYGNGMLVYGKRL